MLECSQPWRASTQTVWEPAARHLITELLP